MKPENKAEIMNYVYMICPLCGEKYKYRVNMKKHLSQSHSNDEALEYLFKKEEDETKKEEEKKRA